MKKYIKIIALSLCLAVFGVFLGGCSYIDEMRADHAILSDDKTTITFRGDTYKLLPKTDKELYIAYNFENIYFYDAPVYVTESDVPVLLKEFFHLSGSYDQNNDAFCLYDLDIDVINLDNNKYYCNERDYDRYVEALECDSLDYIGFEFETWDIDTDYHLMLEPTTRELSDEIINFVKNPDKMTKELYDKINSDYNYESLYCNLFKCDETASVVECLEGFDIWRNTKDGTAYILNYDSETAAQLSDEAVTALKDEYFTGYFPTIVEDINSGEVYFDY